ncbi:MAG: hypothetical protein AAGD43_31745 [Pseudomonadota bacterium]
MQIRQWNLLLGILFTVLSAIALLIWIPNDVETGVMVIERRSVEVGDAMAPTAAAVLVLILSIALTLASLFSSHERISKEPEIGLTISNLSSLFAMAVTVMGSLFIMVYTGPLAISALQALGSEVPEYRLLTDTVPYKYIGFACGGFLMVFSLISWVEGRPSLRAAATAVGAVLALIIIYDVPFDSLLLPPNGSQG